MPATKTDLDHTTPHSNGGRTALNNLGLLCRRHHNAKHRGGWKLDQPRPGVFTWTAPTGRTYTTDTVADQEEANAQSAVRTTDRVNPRPSPPTIPRQRVSSGNRHPF
ncbi:MULTISPECIES: HNH endonuclease signature motif containing protein [unclassified Frankia]|uniref:HNH endonuclease signature motif containing protein n=1 Tax=unclassified Frankia TaxID=2632575 RepID=UPI0027DB8B85|nr:MULTISPECIES: HNH endonuclease signature motif containing protein [unclassified Frankia]